ncbi:MAG: hypothetical protein U9Q04_03175 [Campylobacterota bacterium]|nr:hypothetical protein [Campylobacterota bacterium]
MKKRAYVETILLGFILGIGLLIFVSSSADDIVWHNKLSNLNKIAHSTSHTLAQVFDKDIYDTDGLYDAKVSAKDTAEIKANSILSSTKLGADLIDNNYISYGWCFKDPDGGDNYNLDDGSICDLTTSCESNADCKGEVVVVIENYVHNNFWYRFLGQKSFTFKHIEAKRQLHHPYEVNDFFPLVVNGCGEDYNITEPAVDHEHILRPYDEYLDTDLVGIYGVYDPSGGDSSFAHLKTVMDSVLSGDINEFDINDSVLKVATSNIGPAINSFDNNVKMIGGQVFGIGDFTGANMSIIVADCGSTADNIIMKKVISVHVSDIYCNKTVASDDSLLLDDTILSDVGWIDLKNACNSTSYFKIKFQVKEDLGDTPAVP